MMLLTAANMALSPSPTVPPTTPGLVSAAILILILSMLGLLLLSLVLLRSVRQLKPRSTRKNEPQPRLEDPWFEAGRRMEIKDPPADI
tara:strand:+ start:2799 stop:3062 length:264 start_codon:yes stop_codon:yes gene_type:complete